MTSETYNPILHKVLSGSGKGVEDIIVLGNVNLPPKILGNTNTHYKSFGTHHNNHHHKRQFM